jgi:hypothetical protein
VPLTAVPQRTALSHAFGGLAAGLVGTAKYFLWLGEGQENLTTFRMTAITAEIILGYLTFTGSLMAAGKLQEIKWIPQRPDLPARTPGDVRPAAVPPGGRPTHRPWAPCVRRIVRWRSSSGAAHHPSAAPTCRR